ncbi:MAG: ABC transporter permease [Thermoprotei archaeon]
MGFASYAIRRAVSSVIIVVGAVVLTFILTHVVAPNPASVWAGPHASKAAVEAIKYEYHLDQPVVVQLYYYLIDAFSFNFGVSPFFKEPVSTLIATYFPRTLELVIVAMILTVLIGVYTGAFAAVHQERAGDYVVRALYLVSWSMPPYLVALLLQFGLAYHLKLLPPSQLANPALNVPKTVTGFPTLDALIDGDYAFFYSSLRHLVLPAFTLAFISFGIITRIMRSSMLEAMGAEYVRTAIMKGVGRRRAMYVHAFKNSLIPVITVIALTFSYLIAGSVVVEEVFSYEGMGYLITQALFNYDYPTLIGCTIVVTISVIIINFVSDLVYGAIDPRIRLGG